MTQPFEVLGAIDLAYGSLAPANPEATMSTLRVVLASV